MQNPFYFGNEVSGNDFCNRKAEIFELKADINNGLNVLLYAPRRFGKTSLLKKIKNELKSDQEKKVIFFDFFSISSVEEFIKKYFKEITKELEDDYEKLLHFLKDILRIRSNISVSLSEGNSPVFNIDFFQKENDIILEDIIDIPFKYAEKYKKKIVVMFDEFQEISQFGIEKKLRSVIQRHSRKVCYIFSGSKKSMLREMFDDSKKAFYRSVKKVDIYSISLEDWTEFSSKKFANTGKEIDEKYIRQIFDITKGFPYYTQQIFYVIWNNTEKKVTQFIVDKSINMVLERENDFYAYIWSEITLNQKKTLKYIIRNNGENLYSAENLIESYFTASTLKSTLESLLKKDIIDKKEDIYFIVDPFMKYWLEKQN